MVKILRRQMLIGSAAMSLPTRSFAAGDALDTSSMTLTVKRNSNGISVHFEDHAMEFLEISPGVLLLGASLDRSVNLEYNAIRFERVSIKEKFYVSKYLFTYKDYKSLFGEYPSWVRNIVDFSPLLPMHFSYDVARRLIDRIRKITGMPFDLPTEVQWEYACRGGTEYDYCIGNDRESLAKIAWYKGNSRLKLNKVGQLEPNGFGIFDMLGSLWEPCKGYNLHALGNNFVKPNNINGFECSRGGAFVEAEELCTTFYVRDYQRSNGPLSVTGLRLVINLNI